MDKEGQIAEGPPTKARSLSHLAWWSCFIPSLLALYLLSIGPVTSRYWVQGRYIEPGWVSIAYAPVFLLAAKIPPFQALMARYIQSWCPPPKTPAQAPTGSSTNTN